MRPVCSQLPSVGQGDLHPAQKELGNQGVFPSLLTWQIRVHYGRTRATNSRISEEKKPRKPFQKAVGSKPVKISPWSLLSDFWKSSPWLQKPWTPDESHPCPVVTRICHIHYLLLNHFEMQNMVCQASFLYLTSFKSILFILIAHHSSSKCSSTKFKLKNI